MTELLLEEEDRRLLRQTRDLMDEVLETAEIALNEESMKKLEEAKEDVKKGLTRRFL